MIASDIPTGYNGPNAMARGLATYISDPKEIRRRVLQVFNTCPCLKEVKRMRESFERPVYNLGHEPKDQYKPDTERSALDKVNDEFLLRLHRERRASAIRNGVAFEFANPAWKRTA